MNYSSHEETQDIGSKVAVLAPNTLQALTLLTRYPDGLTTKEISEWLGLSRSPALKHAEKLVELKLGARIVIPHRNPKMPPTHKYRLADGINKEELLQIIQDLSPATKSIRPSAPRRRGRGFVATDIPEAFQSALQGVKSSYRGGYWDTFTFVAHNEPTTALAVREKTGWANSVTHARLTKLLEIDLLEREGQDNQFVYFLSPTGLELSIQCGLKQEKDADACQAEPVTVLRQGLESSEHLDNSSNSEGFLKTMGKNTLDDLASAVKFLASEVAKLNKKVSTMERNQQMLSSEFSFEDIERMVRESKEDSDS